MASAAHHKSGRDKHHHTHCCDHSHDHDDHHHHDNDHHHHHEHHHHSHGGCGHDHGHAPEWLPHVIQHHWTAITVIGAGVFTAIGFIGEQLLGFPHGLALACYLLAYVCGGIDVARQALPGMFRGRFDTDLLMLAAALGAAVLGKWPEGAFLLFLFSLGHAGEHYALDRANNALSELGQLMPKTAWIKRDGRIEEVQVADLAIGDIVLVRPGDRVPADGVVHEGESNIDQSAITGESVPVYRKIGDEIFAGTINQENAIDVRVTRLTSDNTLARVMRLVAEAQEQQSPTQRFMDRFTRRFVPAVLIGTFLVIVVPPLLLGWAWSESFYRGMLLLVAASPCALAIGTPAAVLAGIAQAARHGVLIKGGMHLENLGRLSMIVFDKTGTLTTGRFSVTQIVALEGVAEDELLRTVAAVEEQSNHPLAAAIVEEARKRQLSLPLATTVENIPGSGMRARIEDEEIIIGVLRGQDANADESDAGAISAVVAELENKGQSVVTVRRAGRWLGAVALADQPRTESRQVVGRLKALGIAQCAMLTGDNASVAKAVSEEIGLDEFHAGLLPENKLTMIRELQRTHRSIAMVGDGVNDAPALAAATVGIAMGGAGTAVALETADVALMADDLSNLPFAVGLSRASERIIKQNLVIALGVIALLLLAALTGTIPLSLAVFLHEGSTVAVALNALRLLAWRDWG